LSEAQCFTQLGVFKHGSKPHSSDKHGIANAGGSIGIRQQLG
jgi:hypothetical protein